MRKSYKLNNLDELDDVKDYWGDSVVTWDKVTCTVTIEAAEEDVSAYEAHQSEIHGWE